MLSEILRRFTEAICNNDDPNDNSGNTDTDMQQITDIIHVFNVFYIFSTFLSFKRSLKIPSRTSEALLKPQKGINSLGFNKQTPVST